MSASGTKRTCHPAQLLSAFGSKADSDKQVPRFIPVA